MSEPKPPRKLDGRAPAETGRTDGDGQTPEVRLELTQAGVRQVLSLYAEEADRGASQGAQFTLDDLIRAAVEKWQVLVLCVVVGCLLGAAFLQFAPDLYTVTAEVVLERNDPAEATLGAGTGGSAFIATQAEVLQSRSVVGAALTQAGEPPALDAGADPIAAVLETLQASAVSGTQVVALSYLGPDPSYGARLLSATVGAYRETLRADEQRNQAQRLSAKEIEYAALVEEVDRLEQKLDDMRHANFDGISAEDAATATLQVIRDQTQQLGEVRQRRIELQNQLLAGSLQRIADNPVTRLLQDRLIQAEAELGRVNQTLRPNHPTVEAAQREVNLLRKQLADTERATPRVLERDIDAAKGLEAELTGVLQAERDRLSAAEKLRRDERLVIEELEQTLALMEVRRRALLDQRLISRLAESGEVGVTARLIAEPVQPLAPTWPNPPLVLIISTGVGMFLGLVWAIAATRRSRSNWRDGVGAPRA